MDQLESCSGRILLVDDASDDVEMYTMFLEQKGYRVSVAADGEAAVNAALRETFDVAVVDIGLPKLDGIGVMMVLRNYTKTKRMPLISLSARTGEAVRAAAIDAGANLAVEKPCLPEQLEELISGVLHRQRIP
jgi:two-component system KDP operon response regulator KdpE